MSSADLPQVTAAELDTRRRALGLSIPEMAEVLGIAVRTVSYWMSGDGEPRDPREIAARLQQVEDAMGDLVDHLTDGADFVEIADVTLVRYRTADALDLGDNPFSLPLGAHAMAVSWAMDELRADGHRVTVVWAS